RDEVVFRGDTNGEEQIMSVAEIPLPGRFNVQNVLAAVAAVSLCNVPAAAVREAVRTFAALPHRLEHAGTYNGIRFYDDSIATVPEATLAALEALGSDVQTLVMGGHERNLDFNKLGAQLPSSVRTVILFPPTGERIWKAIESFSNKPLPQ